MAHDTLKIFISSRMAELRHERQVVKNALRAHGYEAWVFEDHAGARDDSIQHTYLEELADSHVYLGLFWHGYGAYTIEEYDHAKALGKPKIVFEKRTGIEDGMVTRDPQLQAFLDPLGKVETGGTIQWFGLPDTDKHPDTDEPLDADTALTLFVQRAVHRLVAQAFPGRFGGQRAAAPAPRAAHYVNRGVTESDVRRSLLSGQQTAVVGVAGMGGVGKTELAIHLARELDAKQPGRAVWVEVSDKPLGAVQAELARCAGVDLAPGGDPADHAAQLRAAYAHLGKVVFLDNIRAAFLPDLPHCLLPCPMLITSRQHNLPLPAGQVYPLDVLDEAGALELLASIPQFGEWAGAEPEAARDLARLCARHPLALSLAARRFLANRSRATGALAAFAAALGDRMGGLHLSPEPGESLAANFDESYEQLAEGEKTLFRVLAAFAPSGFAPEAAAAVAWLPLPEANAAILRLADASLLDPADAPGRWQLHDLLAEYARKQSSPDEQAAASRALADHLIQLFDANYAEDPSTAPHVAAEQDNLLKAADWAMGAKDARRLALLATKALNWLGLWALFDIWYEWLRIALEQGSLEKELTANTLQAIGDVHRFRQENDAALEKYAEALALFEAVGARLGQANTLKAIGDVLQFRKETDAALEKYAEALALYEAVGERVGQANTLRAIGDVLQFRKETDAALEKYAEALALFEAVGDRLGQANTIQAIGDVLQFRKETDAALQKYAEALALYEAVGARLGQANTRAALARLKVMQGEISAAEEDMNGVLEIRRGMGDRFSEGADLFNFGLALANVGEKSKACVYAQQAQQVFAPIDVPHIHAQVAEWLEANCK